MSVMSVYPSGDGRAQCPECGRPIKVIESKRARALGAIGRMATHHDYRGAWEKGGGYLRGREQPRCAGSGALVEGSA